MHPFRPATTLRRLLGGLLAVALALGPVAPALAAVLMDCCATGMHADGHAGPRHDAGHEAGHPAIQATASDGASDELPPPCHGDSAVAGQAQALAMPDAPCDGHEGGCDAGCMTACAATPLGPVLPATTSAQRAATVLIAAVPARAPVALHERDLRPPISA
jgi:hypothetical protein